MNLLPRILLIIGTVIISLFPATGRTDASELHRLFGLGPIETFTVSSEMLDRDFYVYVRLPRSYDESDCSWPVVYMLDGGILFPMLAPYHFMMELDEQAPPAVLVGISYGGLGYANGNLRSTDYTAPAAEPEYYGGAADYQAFLAEKLIPRISEGYRVNHDDSLILGQSLGGQFTLYTALTRPDLFGYYLSINPALHRNVDYFLDLEIPPREKPTPILVTRASEDAQRFKLALDRWLVHRQQDHVDGLELSVEVLNNQYHASSAPAAYSAAVEWWSERISDACD